MYRPACCSFDEDYGVIYSPSISEITTNKNRVPPIERGYPNVKYTIDGVEFWSFIDDEEKMRDLLVMSKYDFLDSYSYLTEPEYDATVQNVMEILFGGMEN